MHENISEIKSRLKVGSYCFRMLCHLEQCGTFTVWEAAFRAFENHFVNSKGV